MAKTGRRSPKSIGSARDSAVGGRFLTGQLNFSAGSILESDGIHWAGLPRPAEIIYSVAAAGTLPGDRHPTPERAWDAILLVNKTSRTGPQVEPGQAPTGTLAFSEGIPRHPAGGRSA